MKTRLYIFLFLLASTGCISYDDMITDWHYASDELKHWIPDSTQFSFIMQDQNGIKREFLNWENQHSFTSGSSYFAGIKYHKSQRENFYQKFRSNYNDTYSILIDPMFGDGYSGEQINFKLNDLGFTYDYQSGEVIKLETDGYHEWLRMSSEGIQSDTLFSSTFEILDLFNISERSYPKTFHFHLDDFHEQWTKFTITDVYYAQEFGLIRYDLNNGLIFQRQNE